MKYLLTILYFTLISLMAKAQVYPIQVTTQLRPPFTPYLSDYTAPGAEKLMVQIIVTDPTVSDYTCKLRLTIEGVNITIKTKQNFVAQPITLQGGGIPQIFYGEDLQEYFNPNALEFSGISRSQYEKGAKLPEGVYRFTIEVLDYNRGTVVSNKGNAVAWVILNDPPILNLPYNNSKTKVIDPTNIPFTWTPRHTGSPNAAFTTEYKFRMVEVWPITRNPFDAFLSQPTLYETTTDLTQIVYGIAEPALLPGRKYAWQVQAVDVDGRDLFKNNGKSEVFVFQYGDALGIPDGLYLQNAGSSSLNVRWEAPANGLDPSAYRIQYRPHVNRKSDNWYETTTTDLWRTIDQLQPDTEYEVQLRAELNTQYSNYGAAQVFKTSPASSSEFACSSDVKPPPVPATGATPKLNVNDVIHAGGYEVQVKKVTASTGSTFSGEGAAIVPWFMNARVHVTFKDISINEQLWLTAGEIKTVWNANSVFLKTIEKPVVSGSNAPDVGAVDVTLATADEVIKIEGTAIVTVTKDSDDNIVVYTSNGEQRVLPKDKSYAIVDEVGNGYVVDKQGNIAKTTATEAQKAVDRGNRTYNIAMRFDKGTGKFGFDKKKFDQLIQFYQQIDATHYADWKAVTTPADPVDAILEGTKFDSKNIRFEVASVPITPQSAADGKYTLNVSGKGEGVQEELLALYKESEKAADQVLGKLNLISYDKVDKAVIIVPVNDNTLPLDAGTLQTELNKIYAQAIANWTVTTENGIKVTFTDKFNDGESGALTNYTDDMKTVINAYGSGKLKDNTYYLFLVSNSKSGNTLGYMPRSKQAGFIFVDKLNSTTIVNTIAHELGHGAFNLQHTFKEFPGLDTKADNLMDYPNGSSLYKYQWDYVHHPQRVIGLFEDDEDGQSRKIRGGIANDWRNNDGTVNFMAPDGKIVRLPSSTSQAYFTFGIGEFDSKDHEMVPAGLLKGFDTEAITTKDTIITHYVATWKGNRFTGYYAQGSSKNAAAFYGTKGDAAQGAGTAVFLIYNSSGSQVVRYSGLPNEYMLSNSSEGNPYMDLADKNVYIKASNQTRLSTQTYENKQIEFNVSATSPRPEYAKMFDILTDNDRLKCQLLVTKIYEYRIVYPDLFERMTVDFGNWSKEAIWVKTVVNDLLNRASNPTGLMEAILQLPKAQLTAGYFEYFLRNKDIYLENNADSKQSMLTTFLTEFRKMIDLQTKLNSSSIAVILDASACNTKENIYKLEPLAIRNAVEVISITDLKKICPASRAYLIGKILEAPVVVNSLENAIYKLMWTCPTENYGTALFLQELANSKNTEEHCILGTIPEAIDDKTLFMGQNFNTMVMNFIIRSYGDYMKYVEASPDKITSEKIRSDFKFLKTLDPSVVAYLEGDKLAEFKSKIVTYNYVGFTKRLFKSVLASLSTTGSSGIPLDIKSVVHYNSSTGTLDFTNKVVQGFVTVTSLTPLTLEALQPIMLNDKAKLIDIYASSNEDGGMYVPAITLYFMEGKADAKTTAEGIGTAVDLASLAIPGANATLALKLLNYADKLSSVASLVGNASNDNYPQFAQYLQITSAVLGGINMIGSAAASKVSKLNTLEEMKAMKDGSKAIKAIDHTQNLLSAERHAEEVAKLCDRLTNIKPNDAVLLDLLNKGGRERELLIKTLELEKSAASAAENSAMVEKLDNAIERLRSYSNAASGVVALSKTSRMQTLFARLIDKFKGMSGKFVLVDGKYLTKGNVQIAHLEKGELVIDKFNDLNDLSAQAKLEESLTDVPFYKPGVDKEAVEDVLIFDDAGTIKCVGGNNCFVAGTQVCIKNGTKTIEQVHEDDVVLSYNEMTGRRTWEKVIHVFKKTAKKLNRIVVGEDTLLSTPEHRFFVKASGWVKASALTVASLLQTQEGYAAVQENISIDTVATVYNFTVDNTHTYYVGTENILTHNDCEKLAAIIQSLGDKGQDFVNAFKSNKELLDKFVDGTYSPAIWSVLNKIDPSLAKSEDWIKKIKALGAGKLDELEQTWDLISKDYKALASAIEGLPGADKIKFLDDFGGNASALKAINGNPELIDAWKKLDDLGNAIPDAIRKNPDVLKKTQNWGDDLYSKLGAVKKKNPIFFDRVNDNPQILEFFQEGSSIIHDKSGILKAVELDMYAIDRARDPSKSIFEPGTTKYVQNTTRKNLADMDINTQSGKIRDVNGNVLNTDNVNGEGLMYVIDESDNIIIGGRGGIENSFPHPTLVGGTNPNVKSAGMIRFKDGRILEISNNSGHFKPSSSVLQEAEKIFKQKMPANSFDSNFNVKSF